MIPRHLRVAGFLSYQQPIELDFDSFDLACISGHNGAGKSSLLDAMTWALFGKARGKSADVINLHPDVKAAEVSLTFEYEGAQYRILRKLPRAKSAMLEFQILDDGRRKTEGGQSSDFSPQPSWRPLTEKSVSETQARIEQTLRMDYDTFINASFFLQGKADQFTQRKAGERKAILSAILGLEVWEEYKERAADQRKKIEDDIREIDGHLGEIESELSEEPARKARLAELEKTLAGLSAARAAQESLLENLRRAAVQLDGQRKLAQTLSAALEKSRAALRASESRLAEKESTRSAHAATLAREQEIEAAYTAWRNARQTLESFEAAASRFHAEDEKRQPLLRELEVERAKLEQEIQSLNHQRAAVEEQSAAAADLQTQINAARQALQDAEAKLAERGAAEARRNAAREKLSALKAENQFLRKEMDDVKARIDKLQDAQGAACPLCGQDLSAEHRQQTLDDLEKDGKQKGDSFRANAAAMKDCEAQIAEEEFSLARSSALEAERAKLSNFIAQWGERLAALETAQSEWNEFGAKRLAEAQHVLQTEAFAQAARATLQTLNAALAKLGYDAAAHDAARREEAALRPADEEHRLLQTAREVLKQVEEELSHLRGEVKKSQEEVAEQEQTCRAALDALGEAEAQTPNLQDAERKWLELKEEENDVREQMGGAQQKVQTLDGQRARQTEYERQREELRGQVGRYKILERSFGKDGVPSLLIEQALPQIQDKANDLLERLSDGQMSIRFNTLAEYKDKKRDDRKETLEIQISDGSGLRDYEMYSGGEAFRINFAIRLALSEILAQRKGARLQTLVIDEGFGSQDSLGRQRLVEAINLVRHDFAKILIITHLDELKDAFPNRIEVEKTERGSLVRVV
ncbi:MAG: hypothetical protein Fur002_12680 [Anaerolineales bacterium]